MPVVRLGVGEAATTALSAKAERFEGSRMSANAIDVQLAWTELLGAPRSIRRCPSTSLTPLAFVLPHPTELMNRLRCYTATSATFAQLLMVAHFVVDCMAYSDGSGGC